MQGCATTILIVGFLIFCLFDPVILVLAIIIGLMHLATPESERRKADDYNDKLMGRGKYK